MLIQTSSSNVDRVRSDLPCLMMCCQELPGLLFRIRVRCILLYGTPTNQRLHDTQVQSKESVDRVDDDRVGVLVRPRKNSIGCGTRRAKRLVTRRFSRILRHGNSHGPRTIEESRYFCVPEIHRRIDGEGRWLCFIMNQQKSAVLPARIHVMDWRWS
jgi:hypothetical protein